ncbi:MAG: glycyl-radical enzyme activating protein [Bacteroidota bacterium]
MTGTIFNIQRFSVNDGPGIRTTVFLKGCPLHCVWCHNPESISPEKELMLHGDRCIRCGDCVAVCEQHAVRPDDGGFVTDREKCIQCGRCLEVCYAEARVLMGKEVTADEVMTEIVKDTVFFDQSSGGATFSGGEPLLQHQFLISLLEACKGKSIHTAVDTSGYTSTDILREVSRFVDLFLYDVKTLDEAVHQTFTGISNLRILDNLRLLIDWGKNVIVRVPIIPGINDNSEELRRIGVFVGSLKNIQEIHLLPYHRSGTEKYRRLGREYPLGEVQQPSPENLTMIASELRQFVPRVIVGG